MDGRRDGRTDEGTDTRSNLPTGSSSVAAPDPPLLSAVESNSLNKQILKLNSHTHHPIHTTSYTPLRIEEKKSRLDASQDEI